MLVLLDEAVASGARQSRACEVLGLSVRAVQRWRHELEDRRRGAAEPANRLTEQERSEVLQTLLSPRFRDLPPEQVEAQLADDGRYLCSASTMYRLLRSTKLSRRRGPVRAPRNHRPAPLKATGPNQVWSWDITYLRGPVAGAFLYLYMVTDVWSRKVVGWTVRDTQSDIFAAELLSRSCSREGVRRDQVTLHSDNGSPMKGATLLATLQALGVATSFSRPSVSDDNAYSESLFRTFKYRPGYPRRGFCSLSRARDWVEEFVRWYNAEHRHSGIRFVTPDQRHSGGDTRILERRAAVYEAARQRNPRRWTGATRNWTPVADVVLNGTKTAA